MNELLTLLLVALAGGVVGAWANSYFQAKRERQRELDREAFHLFERLALLRDVHWSATVLEFHGEPLDPEEVVKYNRLSWEVADMLREIDEIPEAEDILRAMWSLDYTQEKERYDDLSAVLERLGKRLNPKYHDIVSKLGAQSRQLMQSDFDEYKRRRRWVYPLPSQKQRTKPMREYTLDEVKASGVAATWTGQEEEFGYDDGEFLWHPWDSSSGGGSYSWKNVPDGKELPTEGWHHSGGCECEECRKLW